MSQRSMWNSVTLPGRVKDIDHLKKGKVVASGIPLGLTGTPGRSGRAGAAVGQDNDYVFGELLALTDKEIRTYAEAGAIEAAEPRWALTVLPPQLSALAACRFEGRL